MKTYKVTGKISDYTNELRNARSKYFPEDNCWTVTAGRDDSIFQYEGDLVFTEIEDEVLDWVKETFILGI